VPRRLKSWKRFLLALVRKLKRDDVIDEAAAVTYFGILALFPFLLFLVSLASLE
jgi:membrane protein